MLITADAPSRVRTAIILLWVSVLFTLVRAILGGLFFGISVFGAAAVVIAIYGLVIFRVSRRVNWARWVLLAWTVLGAVAYLANFQLHAELLLDTFLEIASFAVELPAVCMLFTAAANGWYRPEASP